MSERGKRSPEFARPRFCLPGRPAALAAMLTIMVGGCHLGPEYTGQNPAVPAAYAAIAASDGPEVSAAWWKSFGSMELDRLMVEAQAGGFDIQAAIARVTQADAQLRVAGSALLPQINAAATQTWQRSTSEGFRLTSSQNGGGFTTSRRTADTRSYSLGPSISYEADFWGANRATRDAAAANALFSRFDRETVRLTTLTGIATAWFNSLAFQDRLSVSQRNLRDSEDILRAIVARQAAGTASQLDVVQQQTLVAGIRAQMPALRLQRDQQVAALAVLVGRLPETISTPTGTLELLHLPRVSPGLPSTLLARRPDVAAAEANLISQNANMQAARAAFFPAVSLTGSAGWQSAALTSLINPSSVLLSVAASASQAIFDNGKLTAQYESSRARYDELLADYRRGVVQAFVDVENALASLRETTEQERLERDAVAAAQRAADIAREQVRAGTLDIVTALQTQTTLFTDLDLLVQARVARFQAVVNLYKALGGGWSTRDVIPPETPIYNGVL
jgi:multidrug efflux system outer membrane protein